MELRMSRKERDRLKVLAELRAGRLKQVEAARLLKLSVRQVRRIAARYAREGDAGLVHRLRGRSSNGKIDDETRGRAIDLVSRDYYDFGPTLASEKLAERDGIRVSRETLRRWMVAAGLWKRRPRRVRHRQWRARRSAFGELVQMDTSIHPWFEGRGEGEPVLITMIDDATGRVLMRFYESDTTLTNMEMIGRYIRRHGRPVAIYADRASHFVTTRPQSREEALGGRRAETHVKRALRELDIEYIPAGSPQAKGRVERSFATEQDRLVKELRLAGISTIEEANEFLDADYIRRRNERFSVPAGSSADAHRRLNGLKLGEILCVREPRTVANDYTIRYRNRRYQIEKKSAFAGLMGSKVTVETGTDGSMRLGWNGKYLKYHEIEGGTKEACGLRPSAPVELRSPSATGRSPQRKPPNDHPWRKPFNRTLLLCTKEDISTLR